MIDYPERIHLARLPTPLQHLQRTSEHLGVEIHVKRDDMTGVEVSGNKIRKLEFLLADAISRGADTVLTCGGEQSNHCRATAMAAARLGLRSVLLLRTDDPASPPGPTGNILLDRLVGAEIVWVSRPEYARRAEILEREAERVRADGRTPYIIPEGGSNATGTWGYIRAAEELANDLASLPPRPTTIVYAAGSGGTSAGLIAGAKLMGFADKGISIAGICVCDDRAYFAKIILGICEELAAKYNTEAGVTDGDIEIIEGYVGLGYGKSQPAELEVLRDLARREAVILDPVYSGKAFYGLSKELERDRGRFGERVVFVHTGGIFRLFCQDEKLASLL